MKHLDTWIRRPDTEGEEDQPSAEDCNEANVEIRNELIQSLLEKLPQASAAFLGCCWSADIERLRNLATLSNTDIEEYGKKGGLCERALKSWKQNVRKDSSGASNSSATPSSPPSTTPSSGPSTPAKKARSQGHSNLAKSRDNNACVVTHAAGAVEAAHIVPACLLSEKRSGQLEEVLSLVNLFHSQEEAQQITNRVRRLIEQPNAVDNLISLSSDCHKAFNEGRLGLKPRPPRSDIDSDREMELQAFLQPAHHEPRQPPMSTRGLTTWDLDLPDNATLVVRLRNQHLETLMTGDVITMRTDNPITKPLPSRCLLMFQSKMSKRLRLIANGSDDGSDCSSDADTEHSSKYNDTLDKGKLLERTHHSNLNARTQRWLETLELPTPPVSPERDRTTARDANWSTAGSSWVEGR